MKHKILSVAFVFSLVIGVGSSVGTAAADDWTNARFGSACPGFLQADNNAVLGDATTVQTASSPTPTPQPNPTPPTQDPEDPTDPIHIQPIPVGPEPAPIPTPTPAPYPCIPCGCCVPRGGDYQPSVCMMRMCPL